MMFRISLSFLSALLLTCCAPGTMGKSDMERERAITPADTASWPAGELSGFTGKVRDGKIGKDEALKLLRTLIPLAKDFYAARGGKSYSKSEWVFPLRGYTSKNVGGKNGNGFIDEGYSFFDGNRHKGHPALDIFVNDVNQDCLDDKTKQPVDVLSVSGGIVVSVETAWDTKSELRGGKYTWVFDPGSNSLFYYAHNSEVLVQPGTLVKPGDVIAHVGRTGFNAYKKRSPTHLHFMQLLFDSVYYPHAVNPYPDLLKVQPR